MPDLTEVAPWLYYSILPAHRALLHLYFSEIAIRGRENIPEQGSAILASKHFSRWDPLILALLSEEPLRFMVRSDQMTGAQGWLIRRLGGFSLDSNHSKTAALRHAINLLHAGKKLVIFPEGGIVRSEPLRTIKTGVARLVVQAEATSDHPLSVPVVPIAIRYLPTASLRAKVFVQLAPPLYTEQYRQETSKQTAQALTSALQKEILRNLEAIN